jgi:hypothetical protein
MSPEVLPGFKNIGYYGRTKSTGDYNIDKKGSRNKVV